ncbi:MAG: flagellar hook capping FlgD N-terminal domain-containing protein [Candidatus Bathyarchaeia archaeon]
MSGIGSVTTASRTTGTTASAAPDGLGKNDFLRLLVTQLQHQDPMNPVENSEFMGQMAQFTSVEQLSNMAASLERMSFAGQLGQAVALIGRTVTWDDADGAARTGAVTSVTVDEGEIAVHVGEETIAPADVRSIA